jgi:hypothetical protein
MSFAGKWLELEFIMLSIIGQAQKSIYHMLSFLKPSPKTRMMMIIMGHKCERGAV